MPAEIVMPRMSDTMVEGRIVRWLKSSGDEVQKGEPLVEIETDKAVMQLESYEAGTLERLLLPEGETAPIGQPIALIETARERGAPRPTPVRPPAVMVQVAPRPGVAERPTAVPRPGERVKASPIARRIAEEQGINLAEVKGTGPTGRITREDLEAYISTKAAMEEMARERAVPPAAPVVAPAPAVRPEVPERPEIIQLSRMRKTIAERMVESKTTVPHFYVTGDVDVTEAMDLRGRLNAAWEPDQVGVTDLIVRAVGLALHGFPNVNASYWNGRIERHAQVNVGIAVAMPDEGVLVPVVRNADRKSLREISREVKALVERTRSGRAQPGDLGGSTFSISNLGMYDVDQFIAIVAPPEAGILAVGSITARPVVVDGQIRVAQRMRVTLSGDHRVFAGETAARFLQELKRLLENPLELLR